MIVIDNNVAINPRTNHGGVVNTLTEPQKAYLAGFMDGEGCITIFKQLGKNSKTPYTA